MYKLTDNGASLRFETESRIKRVIKHRVQSVQAMGPDVVKVDVGDPLRNLYLRRSEVEQPVTENVEELCSIINAMITNCVCCDCDTVNPN